MKQSALRWMSLVLSASSLHAYAEGGCPDGSYPQGGQGWQTCVPIPGYEQRQQSQAGPQRAAPKWESRWGAIATDAPQGVLGTSINELSRRAAERSALADCKSKGGSPCKLEMPYTNSCIAFTTSDQGYNASADITPEKAAQMGMKTCQKAGDSNCRTYYAACSLPVQIR